MNRQGTRRTLVGAICGLAMLVAGGAAEARIGMPAPEIADSVWLNGAPTKLADLKGKVVMVEFWTFGCYNCRNVEPYIRAWHQKYAGQGLVVIGVHSPEFNDEKDVEKVKT